MAKAAKSITPPEKVNDETLRAHVGYHMKRAFNIVQADLTLTLKPFELRMLTYTALALIVGNPGLSQAQLAQAMGIERPNLVVIVDELERRELIVRGRRLFGKANAAVIAHENRLFADMDDATRGTLTDALSRIRKQEKT